MLNFEIYFKNIIDSFYRSNPLAEPVKYILFAKSKQIRAHLCELFCEFSGGSKDQAWSACAAIEMIHSYSLIHDDLPCMDNDSMRRGKPALHIHFNEATALLTGDALLTDAFQILSRYGDELNETQRLLLISTLSQAAGSKHMIQGQFVDLFPPKTYTLDDILSIHTNKTAALLKSACLMGLYASPSYQNSEYRSIAAEFGENFGLAFQIQDDLLDSSSESGKTPHKDQRQNKLSISAVLSTQEAERLSESYTRQALDLLPETNIMTSKIRELILSLLKRKT